MKEKLASESVTIQDRLVQPGDTNHIGTVFGGNVLAYVDEVAALAAMKHSNQTVVTASFDSVDFVSPAKSGDMLHIEGVVTYTGRTSMEVYVQVTAHNILSGEAHLTAKSFVTMVAVNEEGRPVPVPKVIPQTDEEIRLYKTAPMRKEARLNRKEYQ
ncbi:MAG TPA: acyl-CoA thioesterase [Candidatus Avamphibacillus intestinigallinarum]|nr:acyl-CoA thioesterase [Candidatus Avamphibacillus intestinigallinarum]